MKIIQYLINGISIGSVYAIIAALCNGDLDQK